MCTDKRHIWEDDICKSNKYVGGRWMKVEGEGGMEKETDEEGEERRWREGYIEKQSTSACKLISLIYMEHEFIC